MKAGVYIMALLLVTACSSLKQTHEQTTTDKTKIKTDELIEKVTESVNDTLQGVVPLAQLTAEPLEYNFGSVGTQLNLKLQDGKLTYKATSKATTKKVERNTKKQQVQKDERTEIETKTKKEPWRPPWWLSGVGILVVGIITQVISKKFKIIKI